MIIENRMYDPNTGEVRSVDRAPAHLAASVREKNESRTGFTPEARAEAERRLKEIESEL